MAGTARRRGRIRALLVVALVAVAALAPGSVSANTMERFGPNTYEGTFIGFECDGFDIVIQGRGSDRWTFFFDNDDEIVKAIYSASFPHDVMTNSVTGRSIVVRGEFQELIERIPGTDEYTKTVVGFRYMVNEPGAGATIRDVGRIGYGDLEQSIIDFQAGRHDLALDDALWPTFCSALA